MTNTITPRIYIGTYAAYNSGSLRGGWLFLDDYDDSEAFYEACRQLHKAEADPELMFQDWEGIPDNFIDESELSPDYWSWREIVENSHLDREVFDAAAEIDIPADEVEECYAGEYSTRADLAAELLDDTGELDQIPENLRHYFDYDSYGRDLLLGGDVCRSSDYWFWAR